MDSVVLRAYGTFGHPNVLAGWAVVCLLILIQISQTVIPKASKQRDVRGSDPLRRSWPAAKMFSRLQNTIWRPGQTLLVPITLTAFIILLTQSRSAGLTLFGLVIPFYLIKKLKVRLVYFAIVLSSLFSLLSPTQILSPSRAELSLSQRLDLQGISLKVISRYPIFGTGAQASISTYPSLAPGNRLLQPDHNSFTLFLSWFGLLGVLATILILKSKILNLKSFIPIVPLLLLDHYFLTSPQGLFIFLLYLKLNYSHAQKNI